MRAPLLHLLLLVWVSGVYSGHNLQYFLTLVSVSGNGLLEYVSDGYVDGIEITHYDSDTRRLVPVIQWMKKVDPKYWDDETRSNRALESEIKSYVKTEMIRRNHTEDFHCAQLIFGCELGDDGSTKRYMQVGYDGKDYLALDLVQGKIIAQTDEAQISAQLLNSPEVQAAERTSIYLKTFCIDWLKQFIGYGKEELNRRVRPKVKVSDQNVNGVTKLHCQVYGFYPRDVDVKWQKNGIDVPSHEAKHVLPNSDGTYQIRVTVEVPAEDQEGHSCHVDHASLKEILAVKWESQSSSNMLWIVIGVLAGVIAIGFAAVGFIIWRKRSDKDRSSASSTA